MASTATPTRANADRLLDAAFRAVGAKSETIRRLSDDTPENALIIAACCGNLRDALEDCSSAYFAIGERAFGGAGR